MRGPLLTIERILRLAVRDLGQRRLLLIALLIIPSVAGFYSIQTYLAVGTSTLGSSRAEALTMDNYSITNAGGQTNATILTLVLRNSGSVSVTVATLAVKDLTIGNVSPTFSLNVPTIPAPEGTSTVRVDSAGSGFYFIHGHSYTFNITTTKPTHMSFGPVTYA